MGKLRKLTLGTLPVVALSGSLVMGALVTASASSHREAPLITEDPVADLTDVYAFVSPDRPDTTTLIMNVIPFEDPAGGPNFYKFGDDVLYQFKIDNTGDSEADIAYQFRFTTTYTNPNTFLYNTGPIDSLTDPDLNVRQSYSVTEIMRTDRGWERYELAQNVPVAPWNVGVRSYATTPYDTVANAAITDIGFGKLAFAGPRDDPFFVDLGSIFDLGGLRPLNGAHLIPLPAEAGKDYVAGYNVHTISLQIPTARLTNGSDPVIGVWATTARRTQRVLNEHEGNRGRHRGDWVQVSRLGMPLVNEVVIPVGLKDKFNASQPRNDIANFGGSIINPELGALIPVLYPGVTVPTQVDAGLGLGGREDLAVIFATGLPGLNRSATFSVPGEMLRLNTSIAPNPTPNRLGVLGGDTQGFPNGRRLTDDVTDIELQAVAGNTPFTPAFRIAPNNALGDGVDGNDKPFGPSFPYMASPPDGYSS